MLLDVNTWDLTLDASGHMALASDPYARVQQVACAVRLFKGELWYNKTRGVPYFQNILGKQPPANYIRSQVERMALSINGVSSATCVIASFAGRNVTGQIQLKLIDGTASIQL